MKRLLGFVLVMVLLAPSCSFQEGEPLCLQDCSLCNQDGCPPDRCGMMVFVDMSCEGKVDAAEVAVDNCVEEQVVVPGNGLMLCASVPVNQSKTVRVRAAEPEEWYWQKTVDCSAQKAGEVVVLTLTCEENE